MLVDDSIIVTSGPAACRSARRGTAWRGETVDLAESMNHNLQGQPFFHLLWWGNNHIRELLQSNPRTLVASNNLSAGTTHRLQPDSKANTAEFIEILVNSLSNKSAPFNFSFPSLLLGNKQT